MAAAKEIRTQIGSIKNTQKITSAMEMVAASKMRKAQDLMKAGQPYAKQIRNVVGHIADANPEYKHDYMVERSEVKRVGYIVVSTDRGLCGGLNVNLFKAVVKDAVAWKQQGAELDFCALGSKAGAFFRNYGGNLIVWDILFGTRWLPEDRDPPEAIGIEAMPGFPMGFVANLLTPFRWKQVEAEAAPRTASPLQKL